MKSKVLLLIVLIVLLISYFNYKPINADTESKDFQDLNGPKFNMKQYGIGREIVENQVKNITCPKPLDILLSDEYWSEIFKVSKHQKKIKPEIILQTLKFMIQETEETDPKLIEFVKSLISSPSSKPRKLSNPNQVDYSQTGQSLYMDKLLGQIRDGFIVEAGAYDGEYLSNSLYFEKERNWSGILIEPLPFLYERIQSKNRKMYTLNACIAKNKPIVAKFKIAPFIAISGRVSEMSDIHHRRVGNSFDIIYVPCFSLNTILKAINVNKVDFFSLDVEGGELEVLSSLDMKNINFRSFVIEHNGEPRKDVMRELLFKQNYNLTHFDGQDDFFIKIEK